MMYRPRAAIGLWNSTRTAAYLGVSVRTIRTWIEIGYLPGEIRGPRRLIRVRKSDAMAMKASWQAPLDFKRAAAADVDPE